MPPESVATDRFALAGMTAVVTGATGLLGAAIVAEFVARGARVIGFDLDPAVERLGEHSPEVTGVALDVSDEVAVLRAVETHVVGGADILVNNAGINIKATPFEIDMDDWDRVMAVNLRGYFLVARAVAARSIAAGLPLSIVNVSSTAAGTSLGRGNLAFALSKAGVNQLTRELAVEWAASGVRANTVQPSQIDGPGWRAAATDPATASIYRHVIEGTPIGRMVTVDEIVGPVVFLASPASSGVTGTLLPVDGGNRALNAAGTVGLPTGGTRAQADR